MKVMFQMSRNLAGTPPVPDLDAQCRVFGYGGPEFPFRHSEIQGVFCSPCE